MDYNLLKNIGMGDVAKNEASIVIGKIGRGYNVRKNLDKLKIASVMEEMIQDIEEKDTATTLQSFARSIKYMEEKTNRKKMVENIDNDLNNFKKIYPTTDLQRGKYEFKNFGDKARKIFLEALSKFTSIETATMVTVLILSGVSGLLLLAYLQSLEDK